MKNKKTNLEHFKQNELPTNQLGGIYGAAPSGASGTTNPVIPNPPAGPTTPPSIPDPKDPNVPPPLNPII